jgi:MSHA biogenesis protein MshE
VEDPVEYRLPGINQVQVNEKIDLTFSRILRSALRQDPDVILVGEMRDAETAQIGLRAAMTGHLVFSTLHTRDAAGTLFRLVDMGTPRFMVASSVQAVVAQRLLRRVCESCSETHTPTPQESEWLKTGGISPEQGEAARIATVLAIAGAWVCMKCWRWGARWLRPPHRIAPPTSWRWRVGT